MTDKPEGQTNFVGGYSLSVYSYANQTHPLQFFFFYDVFFQTNKKSNIERKTFPKIIQDQFKTK